MIVFTLAVVVSDKQRLAKLLRGMADVIEECGQPVRENLNGKNKTRITYIGENGQQEFVGYVAMEEKEETQ